MKIIVGIQARLGSTRLPKKVLADLCGKTMLRRVWDACGGPWRRIVLTTLKESDDELCAYMDKEGMEYRRGSEPDVLSRYAQVANSERPHCLVRVCADAPFLQSVWIARAIMEDQMVFVPQALHAGSWIAWEEANRYAAPYDWEHAGAHWFEEKAKRLELVPPNYLMVNTPEDLEEARKRLAGSPS